MDLHLLDKVVLVAGSSRGIGKAIAAAFLEEGARVCITGRSRADLDATEQEFGRADCVLALEGDLTEASGVEAVYRAIADRWGRLDAMIANLGTGSGKQGWELEDAEWDRLFRLNFQASTRLAQKAIPMLMKSGGCIVFVSSITGVEATLAPLPYSAAKAALIHYSKNLARQLAKQKVRVNCVAPGNVLFEGGSWARRLEERLEERREAVMKHIEAEVPMGRFGTPAEIANLVVFLTSDRASFVTGACWVADGGQTRSV
jgi:3-oxoacyl-[acyl-carrier protein] reductase